MKRAQIHPPFQILTLTGNSCVCCKSQGTKLLEQSISPHHANQMTGIVTANTESGLDILTYMRSPPRDFGKKK